MDWAQEQQSKSFNFGDNPFNSTIGTLDINTENEPNINKSKDIAKKKKS